MTDQTVPVPVDLLKRLFDNTTLTRDVFAGDSVDVRPSGIGALIDIKALIPIPPKVGDTLTEDQMVELPARSVVVDRDGDPWVTAPTDAEAGEFYLWSDEVSNPVSEIFNDCKPFILVYLPDSALAV